MGIGTIIIGSTIIIVSVIEFFINKSIKKILDMGCGNAPIPLILSTKTNAKIIGVEIQKNVWNISQKVSVGK